MTYSRKDVLEATGNFAGFTIPVHIELDSEQIVLSQPEMRELLSHAETIAVGHCICREQVAGCDSLPESCLALNDEAAVKISEHDWSEIALDDAMSLLDATYRQGLVHMAYRRTGAEDAQSQTADPQFVCSCCSCCCKPLNGLRQFKYSDAIARSAYIAMLDEKTCIACGTCIGRCIFGAYAHEEGASHVAYDEDRCFGCGLCIETCPTGAIRLVAREET